MIETKKLIKILSFIFIISFFSINVYAKENIRSVWESSSQEITNINDNSLNNIAYNNGFVTVKTTYSNIGKITTNLTYYDNKGIQTNNKKYTYDYYGNKNNNDGLIYFVKLFTIDDYLYSITTDYYTYFNNNSNYALYKITKYDKNLKEIKHININGKNSIQLLRNSKLTEESNINGYNNISLKDNMITILSNNKLIQVDKNLNNLSSIKNTNETNKLYFPEINQNKNKGYLGYYSKDNITIYTGTVNNKAYIEIYKNNKYSSKITNNSYNKFINAIIINNNIIVVGSNTNNTKSDVLIYNLKGKLIETINNSNLDILINSNLNNNSFITTILKESNKCKKVNHKWQKTNKCYEYQNKIYEMPFNINIQDSIGGKIKVNDNAYSDEKVYLDVKANAGYIEENISIKDANGKEVSLDKNNYTFVMPSSNVTITATFKHEANPTTNSNLYIIASILLLCIIGLFFSRKIKVIN